MTAVRLKKAAAAEIVSTACDKVISQTIACIKMCCVWLIVCIDGNKYTLSVKITLKYALLVCENRDLYITVAECLKLTMRLCKTAEFGFVVCGDVLTDVGDAVSHIIVEKFAAAVIVDHNNTNVLRQVGNGQSVDVI